MTCVKVALLPHLAGCLADRARASELARYLLYQR
jgi:hypothetical protein